jgi:hypothetical protein
MDNDFPLLSKETANPRSPYDVYKRPDESKEKYGPPPEGFERPTPVKKAGNVGWLQEYVAGMNRFQQQGTNVPYYGEQTNYAQERGGPLMGQTTVTQGIPVGQDPIFPMGQEEFSDYVRSRMESGKQANPMPADLMRRIQSVKAKYGFGSV